MRTTAASPRLSAGEARAMGPRSAAPRAQSVDNERGRCGPGLCDDRRLSGRPPKWPRCDSPPSLRLASPWCPATLTSIGPSGSESSMPSDARRLLVISYYFPPDGSVGGLRWAGITKYLAREGWQVAVLTAARPGGSDGGVERGVQGGMCPPRRTVPEHHH